jgi:hypothetical protein
MHSSLIFQLKTTGKSHDPIIPYLAYPSGFPVKEFSLQVPLIDLHRREMPPSGAHLHSSFNVYGTQVPLQGPH